MCTSTCIACSLYPIFTNVMEGNIWFAMLSPKVYIFMACKKLIFLLELTQESDCGTNLLLDPKPRLEPWENTLEHRQFLQRKLDFFFWKVDSNLRFIVKF